jgi:hypothetical protein
MNITYFQPSCVDIHGRTYLSDVSNGTRMNSGRSHAEGKSALRVARRGICSAYDTDCRACFA